MNHLLKALLTFALLFFCIIATSSSSLGETIAYNINTTDLSVISNFDQNGCPATETIDGILDESGWGVYPNFDSDNFIVWSIPSGKMTIEAMQIVNDLHWNHPHNLIHFELFYTSDINPSLNSTFLPLNITSIGGFGANIYGNEIQVTSPSTDYRLFFQETEATGILLHTFPFAGNFPSSGNFYLNEVSFDGEIGAVPIPSSILLLSLSILGLMGYKRRF